MKLGEFLCTEISQLFIVSAVPKGGPFGTAEFIFLLELFTNFIGRFFEKLSPFLKNLDIRSLVQKVHLLEQAMAFQSRIGRR